MGRRVKLQDTGEYSNSDVAYKAPNCKYYTSQEVYEDIINNRRNRELCVEELISILNYKEGMKLPTLTFKKISENEVYGYDVLLDTIIGEKDSIEWAINNKKFNGETAKIMYIFAIVQNHIMDYYKKKIREKEQIIQEKKNEVISTDIVGTSHRSKNISSLLGGDEWI